MLSQVGDHVMVSCLLWNWCYSGINRPICLARYVIVSWISATTGTLVPKDL